LVKAARTLGAVRRTSKSAGWTQPIIPFPAA
jgi:hypothetical protein